MIPWFLRTTKFRFSPDCPDHVKARTLCGLHDVIRGEGASIPLCDREYVTRTDEIVAGWWFPLAGFVPSARIREAAGRLLRRLFPRRRSGDS